MHVFITGASGFLGTHLVRALVLQPGVKISAAYRDNPIVLPKPHHAFRLDMENMRQLEKKTENADAIIHLAGMSSGTSLSGLLQANVLPTARLLEASSRAGVKQFLLASTAAVYGSSGDRSFRETDLAAPETPYGLSKFFAERLCRLTADRSGLRVGILRFSNIYGPGNPGNVIARFMAAIDQGQPPLIHGNGLQRRDFVYVEDAVRALLLALKKRAPERLSVWNAGSGQNHSLRQLLAQLQRITGKTVHAQYDSPESGTPKDVWISVEKIKRDLRWEAKVS
ncbi:MAG: NAD-dependent epimerase/dehydratase family protein, partial [Candidatus Omnitrophica bacterium]|nr:NAD-dependent epimerase/dehydratase family protein [Candidatus Omnitrophota bacterium]